VAPQLPLVAGMVPAHGAPTAYICQHFTCRPPITAPDALAQELTAAVPRR
jgi:uncharacterized protein YyaL (SSP411 family)